MSNQKIELKSVQKDIENLGGMLEAFYEVLGDIKSKNTAVDLAKYEDFYKNSQQDLKKFKETIKNSTDFLELSGKLDSKKLEIRGFQIEISYKEKIVELEKKLLEIREKFNALPALNLLSASAKAKKNSIRDQILAFKALIEVVKSSTDFTPESLDALYKFEKNIAEQKTNLGKLEAQIKNEVPGVTIVSEAIADTAKKIETAVKETSEKVEGLIERSAILSEKDKKSEDVSGKLGEEIKENASKEGGDLGGVSKNLEAKKNEIAPVQNEFMSSGWAVRVKNKKNLKRSKKSVTKKLQDKNPEIPEINDRKDLLIKEIKTLINQFNNFSRRINVLFSEIEKDLLKLGESGFINQDEVQILKNKLDEYKENHKKNSNLFQERNDVILRVNTVKMLEDVKEHLESHSKKIPGIERDILNFSNTVFDKIQGAQNKEKVEVSAEVKKPEEKPRGSIKVISSSYGINPWEEEEEKEKNANIESYAEGVKKNLQSELSNFSKSASEASENVRDLALGAIEKTRGFATFAFSKAKSTVEEVKASAVDAIDEIHGAVQEFENKPHISQEKLMEDKKCYEENMARFYEEIADKSQKLVDLKPGFAKLNVELFSRTPNSTATFWLDIMLDAIFAIIFHAVVVESNQFKDFKNLFSKRCTDLENGDLYSFGDHLSELKAALAKIPAERKSEKKLAETSLDRLTKCFEEYQKEVTDIQGEIELASNFYGRYAELLNDTNESLGALISPLNNVRSFFATVTGKNNPQIESDSESENKSKPNP